MGESDLFMLQDINLYPDLTKLSEHCSYATIQLTDDVPITLVEVRNNDRESIDAWMDFSADIRRSWPEDKPLLVLVDMTKADFAFSPYATRRGTEMMKIKHGLIHTYLGWAIKKSFIGQMMGAMLSARNGAGKAYTKICYDREEAYTWLLEQFKTYNETMHA